jgi:single-strand DNA-binding protein
VKVYTTEIAVKDQEFANSKHASSENGQAGSRPDSSRAVGDGFINIPDGVEDERLLFNS